jgi:hypothetical protein
MCLKQTNRAFVTFLGKEIWLTPTAVAKSALGLSLRTAEGGEAITT